MKDKNNKKIERDNSVFRTPEFRKKMSEIVKSQTRHPNSLKNLELSRHKPKSEIQRKKISDNCKNGICGFQKGNQVNKGRTPYNKGKKMPEEQVQKLKDAWSYEKHVTPEILEKRGKSISKKWKDPDYRSKQMKRLTENPPNKGYVPTLEQREAARKRLTGNKINLGRKKSEATKEKIRAKRMLQDMKFEDTKPEITMQCALEFEGIQFQKQKKITGRPDFFIRPNICVFVDGDYFHAQPKIYKANDVMKKRKLAAEIWAYDSMITNKLKQQGYRVMRFWVSDLEKDPSRCAQQVLSEMQKVELLM